MLHMSLLMFIVCQILGEFHPGSEYKGSEGVDEPDEADDTDC